MVVTGLSSLFQVTPLPKALNHKSSAARMVISSDIHSSTHPFPEVKTTTTKPTTFREEREASTWVLTFPAMHIQIFVTSAELSGHLLERGLSQANLSC